MWIYLREVHDSQAKACGIPYEKKKKCKRTQQTTEPSTSSSATAVGSGRATTTTVAASAAQAGGTMSVSPPQETNVTFGMLLKDVVYIATNHVYYELLNYLSFNKWVGIVFYGRKSLGGHNVVWRLYEAIKAHYQNIKLTGFLGGSDGLLAQRTLDITNEVLASYKNQGGFDMLSRTKDQILFLTLIDKEHEGEQIGRAVLKNVLDIFVEIGLGQMECYENDFEDFLLKDTTEYYSVKAQSRIFEDSYQDYMIKGVQKHEEVSKVEDDIVLRYQLILLILLNISGKFYFVLF
ncbi:Pyrophosphate--fructose 6-phosphate 1-phosphotransferase subunit alpha 2 [Zea mays]|uniref:Pyrophosphate--fructose 6-phosphate 1-phosphotransferase subunit alpha 2 n=1 Tax=Zea mays TaxID=4577 RepID=A0A1D6GJM0_MAIZE|nr:Pyrophosphate--fructose 6-phosphate 1-phosphotransferase subunit alpha 2 [Zea mays]